MVLGNFLLLAGVHPQHALRWFLTMYVDAYDWVMAANVIGMSQHADGGFMSTKPYIASGSYIRRMSDYCSGCRFDPQLRSGPRACPFTVLYWDFIDRHAERFASNPRMQPVVAQWRRRAGAERDAVRESARRVLSEHAPY
jgi:deoxyribodipyrimidine photolyase-related protein